MTKILWHSVAPWCGTGYGQQTALFAPRIAARDNIDLALSVYFGLNGGAGSWQGLRVYPSDNDWGNQMLPLWANHFGDGEPVQVITLTDVWPFDVNMARHIPQLACWAPVDHKPCPPRVARFFHESGARPIAMSKFGRDELREAGLDPLYVPHAVDTEVFKPEGREAIRERLTNAYNWPDDVFVVGMVANNQGIAPPRKAFSQALIAFSEFRRRHSNVFLYLHCEMTGMRQGVNLPDMCERYGIPNEAMGFVNQVALEYGLPADYLAGMYNAMDVLLNPSYGEGFGIPIVEAQACGTPVIVTDWTAMPELCGSGWLVTGEPVDDPAHRAYFMQPSVDDVLAKLELAYDARGDQAMRSAAREFALGYDADVVMDEFWLPALDDLARPREVKPLRPNADLSRRKAAVA